MCSAAPARNSASRHNTAQHCSSTFACAQAVRTGDAEALCGVDLTLLPSASQVRALSAATLKAKASGGGARLSEAAAFVLRFEGVPELDARVDALKALRELPVVQAAAEVRRCCPYMTHLHSGRCAPTPALGGSAHCSM